MREPPLAAVPLATAPLGSAPPLTAAELEQWQVWLRATWGLDFPPPRHRYLLERLWNQAQAAGQNSCAAYFSWLTRQPVDSPAWLALQEDLLIHETSFFRHPQALAAITAEILPARLASRLAAGQPELVVWCAGCATGEEAYSLAMVAADAVPAGIEWTVWATDLSTLAIQKTRAASYRPAAVRSVPAAYQQRFLQAEAATGNVRVQPLLTRRVFAAVHNLLQPPPAELPLVDLIVCQNVLIYLHLEDRQQVLAKFETQLLPGGYLVLAPAEGLGLNWQRWQTSWHQQAQIYQRGPASPQSSAPAGRREHE